MEMPAKKRDRAKGLEPRRLMVIDLRCKGYKYKQIAKELNVNESTVRNDMKSATVQDFIDELIRQQLEDIEGSTFLSVALKYRDALLDKLMTRKYETKIEAKAEIKTKSEDLNDLLGKYAGVFERILSQNNTGEPVDTPPPNP